MLSEGIVHTYPLPSQENDVTVMSVDCLSVMFVISLRYQSVTTQRYHFDITA